jgi:hypothetical protein
MNVYQSMLALYHSNPTNSDKISKSLITYGVKSIIVDASGIVDNQDIREYDMFSNLILSIDTGSLLEQLPNTIEMEIDMPYKKCSKPYVLSFIKLTQGLYLCDMKDNYYRTIHPDNMWLRINSFIFPIITKLLQNTVTKLYVSTQFINREQCELINPDKNYPHIYQLKSPFTNFNALHITDILDSKNDTIFTHLSWKGLRPWLKTLRLKFNNEIAIEILTANDFIVAEIFGKVRHAVLLGNYIKFNNYNTIDIEMNGKLFIVNMKK